MYPSPAAVLAGGLSVRPETKALIGRMSVPPSAGRAAVINRLVGRLIDAGLWQSPKFDALYVLAGHHSQTGYLNWMANNSASASGSPPFTVDRGSAGDGSSSYLNLLNLSSSPNGVGHIGMGVQDGFVGMTYAPWAYIDASEMMTVYGTPGGATGFAIPGPGLRHGIMCRTGEDTFRGYKNGSLSRTWNITPPGASYGAMKLHLIYNGYDEEYTGGRAGFIHYGPQPLTDLEASKLSDALSRYMIEIGAWV